MQHRRQVNNLHKHKDKKKNENKKNKEQPPKYYATTTPSAQNETEDLINSFSKRTLTTNWSKYEEVASPFENEQLCAADFENLLVTPASVGSHFVFSTERNWDNNSEVLTSQYFKLNVLDLAKTLASLPFYVRQGYATELFDEVELKEMVTNARPIPKHLRNDLSTLTKPMHKSIDKNQASADVVVPIAHPIQENAPFTDDSDGLNALLQCTVQPISSLSTVANLKIVTTPTTTASNEASKDIQQWLDDIFND